MMLFRLMDTEAVINEVRSRECLWNPRSVYYKNKTDKFKAWEEVSERVLPKYTTCSEYDKQRIITAVQSRWKTARDAYMKCRQTELKKPTYKARKHRYIYQDKLKFLEQVKDIDEGGNNKVRDEEECANSSVGDNSASQSTCAVSEDDIGDVSDEIMDYDIDIHEDFKDVIAAIDGGNEKAVNYDNADECQPETSSQKIYDQNDTMASVDVTEPRKSPRNARTRKLKSKMTEFETKLLKIMRLKNSTTSANTSVLQSDDQFFFNSLAPLLNNFDIQQKLKFRSKILEVVNRKHQSSKYKKGERNLSF